MNDRLKWEWNHTDCKWWNLNENDLEERFYKWEENKIPKKIVLIDVLGGLKLKAKLTWKNNEEDICILGWENHKDVQNWTIQRLWIEKTLT